MNNTATEARSVIVEREMPCPPEKLWRALTQPHLIEEWLMKNDFKPVVDHRFNFRGDWGAVDCQVVTVEPNKTLSYTWGAYGLESIVTWTLTATSTGPICAWSSRASGRISSRPTRAPGPAGSDSLEISSRSWRGSTEICRRNSKQACQRPDQVRVKMRYA